MSSFVRTRSRRQNWRPAWNPRIACKSPFIALLASLVLLTAGVTGCKKSGGTVSVHGHVNYKGRPLASSAITFFPTTGRPATAPAPKGEYSADLLPGDYVATVTVGVERPPGFKEGDPDPKPTVVLPEEYTARTKSKLNATVKQGQSDPIDFDLK